MFSFLFLFLLVSERNISDDSNGGGGGGGGGGWAKKGPIDWDESDATDWLLEAAKEAEIPEEVILRSSYRPLTGADLVHMDLNDFEDKYGDYGRHFYQAFQQQVQLQGQCSAVESSHHLIHSTIGPPNAASSSDLLGLQSKFQFLSPSSAAVAAF